MHIRILGCGPSYGIPSIRYQFEVCDGSVPENTRLRSSILIQHEKGNLLIDTGPDLRTQIIRAGYPYVDAVLYTHDHYDHMGGATDLNGYFTVTRKTIPVYGVKKDLERLKEIVPYMMKEHCPEYYLETHPIVPYRPFEINGIPIVPILQRHGVGHSIGYRIGNDLAYSTDVSKISPKGFEMLKGIKTWVLGVGVKDYRDHCPHLSLGEALTWIEKVKPQRAIITHMGGKLDYQQLQSLLPSYVKPAYDGMEFDV